MKKQRKYYTPEEKVAILRRHLLEQVPMVVLHPGKRNSKRDGCNGPQKLDTKMAYS